MPDLVERVAALESIFRTVNLGDWSNDQDVPWWIAIRIRPAMAVQAALANAVTINAQLRVMQEGKQGEGLHRLVSEIIDDFCGTPPHPHWPHWHGIVAQLGALAERYPAKSLLRDAAFDLSRKIVERAQEVARR